MKFYFLLFLIGPSIAWAQYWPLFNGGFEDTLGGVSKGWQFNQGSSMDTGVHTLSRDAFRGSFAACIWDWYGNAGVLRNKAEGIDIGLLSGWDAYFLMGNYKYLPGNNGGRADSALAEVVLTRFDDSLLKRDTIGYGIGRLGLVDQYKIFGVPIGIRDRSKSPDTVRVTFFSSDNGNCNGWDCLYLYLDDLFLQGVILAEVESGNALAIQPSIFPNPVRSTVSVTLPAAKAAFSVSIHDLRGRRVERSSFEKRGNLFFDLRALPNGIYFMNITGEGKDHILKFLVQK